MPNIIHRGKRSAKPLIKDTHPELLNQFNPELNPGVDINKITEGSGKKIVWQCVDDSKHLWEVNTNNRVYYKNFGCPICAGSGKYSPPRNPRTLSESNKSLGSIKELKTSKLLFTEQPELFKQIDSTKNSSINLTELTQNSGKKIIWTCRVCDKNWKASPNDRVRYNTGCPHCAKIIHGQGTSKLENSFAELISNHESFTKAIQGSKTGVTFESGIECTCDVITLHKQTFRPIIFELDGEYFHKDKVELDTYKTRQWLEKLPNILVVRVRTGDLEFLDIDHENLLQINLAKTDEASLQEVINEIIRKLG